jgi:hypothetical protein
LWCGCPQRTLPNVTPVLSTSPLTLELFSTFAHRSATLRANPVKNVGNDVFSCWQHCVRHLNSPRLDSTFVIRHSLGSQIGFAGGLLSWRPLYQLKPFGSDGLTAHDSSKLGARPCELRFHCPLGDTQDMRSFLGRQTVDIAQLTLLPFPCSQQNRARCLNLHP